MPKPISVIEYRLRIVEIIPPARNANDALQSATTPPNFEVTVPSTTYLLNPALLRPAQSAGNTAYAFSVAAIDRTGRTVLANNGVSQACSFVLSDSDARRKLPVNAITWPRESIVDDKLPSLTAATVLPCGTGKDYEWQNNTDFTTLTLTITNEGDCIASSEIMVFPPPPPKPSTGRTVSRPAKEKPIFTPQPATGKRTVQVFKAPPKGSRIFFSVRCTSGKLCQFRFVLAGSGGPTGGEESSTITSIEFDSSHVHQNPKYPYSKCQTESITLLEVTNDVDGDIKVLPFDVENVGNCQLVIDQTGDKLVKGEKVSMPQKKNNKDEGLVIKKGKKMTLSAHCYDTAEGKSNCAGKTSIIIIK
jgi:hypothetical protein